MLFQNRKSISRWARVTSFLAAILLSPKVSRGCDICGCGIGNLTNGLGQINALQRKYALLEHNQIKFSHPTGSSFDVINRTQINYSWRLNKSSKWQLMAGIPLVQISRHLVYDNVATFRKTSVGDVLVSGTYTAFDNRGKTLSDAWKSVLQLQVSTFLPTGHYQTRDPELLQLPMHLQPGTGAWQGVLGAQWLLSHQNWGFSLSSQYQTAGKNENKYQFGDVIQGSMGILYRLRKTPSQSIVIQMGSKGRIIAANEQYGNMVSHTGGRSNSVFFQADCVVKRTYIRGLMEVPIQQSFSTEAPKLQQQVQFALGYLW